MDMSAVFAQRKPDRQGHHPIGGVPCQMRPCCGSFPGPFTAAGNAHREKYVIFRKVFPSDCFLLLYLRTAEGLFLLDLNTFRTGLPDR